MQHVRHHQDFLWSDRQSQSKTANTTTVTANEVSSYTMETPVNFDIDSTSHAVRRKLDETHMKLNRKQSKQNCFLIFRRNEFPFDHLIYTKVYICVSFSLDLFYIQFEFYYL